MKSHIRAFAAAAAWVTIGLPAASTAAGAVPAYVVTAIDDSARIPDAVAYDKLRLPADIMTFSRIKPGDVIVDLVPGDGYYTRILSRLGGTRSHVFAVVPRFGAQALPTARTDSSAVKAERDAYASAVQAAFAVADVSRYSNVNVMASPIDQFGGNLPLPEQADAVFSAGSYHDFHTLRFSVPGNSKLIDAVGFDRAVFKAMNPGGVFVIIDYAAADGAGFTNTSTLGRSEKSAVVAEVTAAGFVLEEESMALVNSADDHRKSAFDASLGGKPDQFILRFRKPLNNPIDSARRTDDAMDGLYGNTVISFNACLPGPNGKTPICGLEHSEHHLRFYADHTFQVEGLPGDDPLIQGRWFWDARGSACMWGENPSRGTVMCHEPAVGKHVGDKWNWRPYGVNQVRPALVVKGDLRDFGAFTLKDFPQNTDD